MAKKPNRDEVEPLPGLAPWVGGKRHLAPRLAERIDLIPHHTYAEPFVGMGGVFFRRRRAAKAEVINDWSGDVVNLFRVLKHHPGAFLEELRLMLFSRREFNWLHVTPPATLTDVQRAARFYQLQRGCYGGMPGSRSFPAVALRTKGIAPAVLRRQVEAVHARLAKVAIEHMPYAEFIRRYDLEGTLFYLDPPYWGCESLYGKGLFERADFARLAELLRGLQGRFILSLNDVPEIRRLFAWARIERVPVTYKTNGTKKVMELLITGRR